MHKMLTRLTLFVVFLAACSPAATPAPATSDNGGANPPVSAPGQAQTPVSTDAPVALLTTLTPTVAPITEATAAPVVQVKEEFVATNPATVNLAAGKPQLVEFFAVW